MSRLGIVAKGAAGAVALLLLSAVIASAATAPADTTGGLAHYFVVDGDTLWVAEPLEVLGSRVPVALPGVVRAMNVVTETEAERAPARSVGELLQAVPGVVVGQRQQYGVQSDLTMRGSTFDQVLVLLNGFEVGDPQTGHHALDLPVGRDDISRLEVLPGHGSSLYGPGAFGGTVNVVTRRPAPRTGGQVALSGGDNGIWGAQAAGDLRWGADTGSRFSFQSFRSDGHNVDQPDGSRAWGGNDARTWTGTGRVVHDGAGGQWDLFGATGDRRYGALDFYAPFPSYEKTKSLFVSGLYRTDLTDRITVEPRVFYRRHRDQFILFRDRPETYTNDHVSRKFGGVLQSVIRLAGPYALAVSLEAVYEDIDSRGLRAGVWGDALGSHLRRRASLAAEIDRHGGPVRWQVGGRLDSHAGYSARFSGSGSVAYTWDRRWTLRASAGNVYRLPTFTDLYYRDPANVGNPHLVPETGWTWDSGLEWNDGPWSGRLSYYERYEEDLIEWARPQEQTIWQVLNIATGTTRGGEVQGSWRHSRGHGLSLTWSRIAKDTELPATFEGKYTLLVPRQTVNLAATVALHRRLHWTLSGRYLEHTGGPDDFREFFLLDSRLTWRGDAGWRVDFAGTNLGDRRYEEVPAVQMPGTVFTGTLGRAF